MPPKRKNRGKKRGPSSQPEPSPGNRRSRRLNSSPPPQTPRGLEIDMNDAPSSASVSSNPGSASREERFRNRNRKRPGKTGGTFLPPIRESSTINDSDTHSEAPEPTPTSASPTVHLSQPETPPVENLIAAFSPAASETDNASPLAKPKPPPEEDIGSPGCVTSPRASSHSSARSSSPTSPQARVLSLV